MPPPHDEFRTLDEFAKLTDAEKQELQVLKNGARYVGSARNRLLDFAQARNWSEDVLNDVLRLIVRSDA